MEEVRLPENEIDSIETSDDAIVALRTAQQHQVQLNVLADQKANINIGFTLFFITLTQSQFSLDKSDPELIRAGFILLILTITTSLLLALMLVLPRLGKTRIKKPEEMTNALYFGLFTQLKQDDYVAFMQRQLQSNTSARNLLAIDIYQIGQVLSRNYRLLRYGYGFLALSALIAVLLYCFRILAA